MFTFYLTFYNIYRLGRLFSESNCGHIVLYRSVCLQFDHKQSIKLITTVSSSVARVYVVSYMIIAKQSSYFPSLRKSLFPSSF